MDVRRTLVDAVIGPTQQKKRSVCVNRCPKRGEMESQPRADRRVRGGRKRWTSVMKRVVEG